MVELRQRDPLMWSNQPRTRTVLACYHQWSLGQPTLQKCRTFALRLLSSPGYQRGLSWGRRQLQLASLPCSDCQTKSQRLAQSIFDRKDHHLLRMVLPLRVWVWQGLAAFCHRKCLQMSPRKVASSFLQIVAKQQMLMLQRVLLLQASVPL